MRDLHQYVRYGFGLLPIVISSPFSRPSVCGFSRVVIFGFLLHIIFLTFSHPKTENDSCTIFESVYAKGILEEVRRREREKVIVKTA